MLIRGFFDLHTHGAGRYDTRTSRPEDILRIAELHGKEGIAAILPTIYPASIITMRRNIEAVREAIKIQGSEGRGKEVDKGHSAAITGVHLEGPFLNPLRCGALDKDSFLKPDVSSLKRLIDGYEEIIKIITISPELPGALKVIERCREIGIKVNMGHSNATYREAFEAKRAGATGVTHLFNAMRPFHHRDPGIIGLALIDNDLYVEVIADGIHLSPETLRLIFNIKSPERILVVSDSIKGADNRHGALFKKGVLVGSRMMISKAATILGQMGLSESFIKKTLIENPVRYLNLF